MLLISKYGNGSEEFVNGLERKLGIELDEEYRKFLIKYNGGDTPNTEVKTKGFDRFKISDSFSQFLKICKSGEIKPLARRSPEEREADFTARGKAGNITDGLREIWKHEYEKYKDMIQEKVIMQYQEYNNLEKMQVNND